MADQTPPPAASESPEPRPSPLKNPRVRRVLLIAAVIAVVAGIAGFVRYESYGKYQQSTNDAYVQADGVTVSPKVAGYVDKVFVAENQPVKAGDPLVQIDARDYHAQAAQSQAQIDVAEANATGVQAQIGEQQAAITRARADLAAARTDAAYAHSEVARYQPLAASGAETRERLSQLRNQATQADAKVAAAQAALVSAERRIGTLNAQVKQARAQGEGARAQLAAAETNLGATLIRAAIDGRVGSKTVRQGQYVQAATRLMTLVPVKDLYITANFKETQLGLMRPGQPVSVSVDALPGVEIPGRVASVSPGTGAQFSVLPPQNATGNFTKIVQRVPVRIAISPGPETRALLVPGMSVEVSVDTRGAKGAADRIRREQQQHNERIGQ
ncbi:MULTISPECIES: HlyD family secretion protein [unclassified Sphingomonas]|uniref:HlyD family secretion protein n=1 Tax=unclassified Sphingomonas TaxID=196159 RepID=UPI00092B332A|nr:MULTISPECIES: HlyD family secretion protein [unclassified Sphingomonas]OJU16053.1 MAG: multidrug ABC transporter permease [Sphingomonas sp. 66-10]